MLPNLSCTTISSSHTVIYPNNLIDRSLGKVAQLGQLIQQFLQVSIPNLILQTRDQRFRLLRIIAAQTPYSFNSSANVPIPTEVISSFVFSRWSQTTRIEPGLDLSWVEGTHLRRHSTIPEPRSYLPPLHSNSGPEKRKT